MPDTVISTVILRLHRPSRRKQLLLLGCFERYAAGIQQVLDRVRPDVEQLAAAGSCPSLTVLSRLMTPADLHGLKPLGLEPLADGLRMDLAMLLLNYLAHVRNGQPASLPVIRRTSDAWAQLAGEAIAGFDQGTLSRRRLHLRLERTLATVGRCKSIYFGRHAATRDFCLLYQPDTGRFFVKLYLMNRQAARIWSGADIAAAADSEAGAAAPSKGAVTAKGAVMAAGLYHLTDGHPPLAPPTPGDRFIVVPLDMGSRQHALLLQAWQQPQMIRTARLCRKGDAFDLHVQVSLRQPEARQALHLLGLARSHEAAAAYSLCRADGQALARGRFDGNPQAVAAAVCQLARQTAAQVVLTDLSRHRDGLYRTSPDGPDGEPFAPAFSRQAWQTLVRLLERQLTLAGLPRPVAVSPNQLFQTCPACQSRRRSNRLRDSLIVCTACGHSQEVSQAASFNVVQKYLRYQVRQQPLPEGDRTVP